MSKEETEDRVFMVEGMPKFANQPRIQILASSREFWVKVQELLIQRSVQCDHSANPSKLLNQILENRPDALILEMDLIGTSGIEFYTRLRGELGLDAPPCIMISESNDEEVVTSAYEAGAADCLCKPFSIGELMAKLRQNVPRLRKGAGKPSRKVAKLGNFTLIDVVRRGSMSVLYKAFHPRYPGPIALKTLETKSCDLDTLLRFRREVDLLTQLEHPHLAKFCEAGRTRKILYFAMNFIEGKALDLQLKESGPLPWIRVASLIRDLAGAVAHLHAHDILHRDIKPANILLSEAGAVLVDLGLAKHLRDQQLTGSHTMIGTPLYIAPEVLEKDHADERSDLFSLGMVGLQMLLGKEPIEESNLYEIFNRIILNEFCHARDIAGVSKGFAAIIDRLLEVQPSKRFQSALELLGALDKILCVPSGKRK
jgi:CheY-like chemotaxis protein/tRNA A-37 threonylcarbamoyl transferase component Bud32